ncbi:hypothetical protein QNI16_05700 [Cytophagaceae bacterium YF14B1]|uniref:BIG2 domain-containing protein n=1 Tax=Xanthocytophaga flava TaxID=3048013 RepID=A0AAE3U5X2_9BACT|nr:hypothetical protein [Xanthocytophaga flavus]MDJ1479972.1 hypothetical protein [Xanthocytophaga flavus]
MKLINLLLFSAFILFFTACTKKETIPEPEPPKETAIELWLGEDSLYTPENNLVVTQATVAHPDAVSAVVENGKVRLKALQEVGATYVTLTDATNQSIQIVVWTLTPYQLKNLVNHATYKPSVKVQAADAATSATITAELEAKIAKPFRMQFRSSGMAIYWEEGVANPLQASYQFGDLQLEFTVNEVKHLYKVHTHTDRTILALEQDLTAYYQALYPDKGIESVVTTEYVQHLLPPG